MPRWEIAETTGAVVVVDVLRAFTTAAYAIAAGADHILLVDSVAEALHLKGQIARAVVVGEDRGRRPLAIGPGHVHPDDVDYAVRVDRFDFAMEVRRMDGLRRLDAVTPTGDS